MQRLEHVLKHSPSFGVLAGAVCGHPLPINFTREWSALLTGDHLEDTSHLPWRNLSSYAKSGINAGILELYYCWWLLNTVFVREFYLYLNTCAQCLRTVWFLSFAFQTKEKKNLLMRALAIKQSWVCMVEQTTATAYKKESIQKGTDLWKGRDWWMNRL